MLGNNLYVTVLFISMTFLQHHQKYLSKKFHVSQIKVEFSKKLFTSALAQYHFLPPSKMMNQELSLKVVENTRFVDEM